MAKDKTKTAVIYARTSGEDAFSIDNQVNECNNYIKQNGFQKLAEFKDNGSGNDLKRQGLKDLIKFAKKNKPDVVIINSVDRLSRNTTDFISTKSLLSGFGIEIVSLIPQEETPTSRFIERIMNATIELDREIRSSKIKQGLALKKARES